MIVDPRLNEQQSQHRPPQYAEDRCAWSGRRALRTFWLPGLLLVGIVVAAALGSLGAALIVLVFFLAFALLSTMAVLTRLPLGIRMDAQGIRIGGVQAAEQGRSRVRRRDKPIQGFTRAMHVYSCDWQGVQRIRVLTDPQELALMARGTGGPREASGIWWAFLGAAAWAPGRFIDTRTGAALVFEVEIERASFQATRPPKNSAAGDLIYNTIRTMTWVVPTRNPQAIKAALAAARPPVVED